MKELIKKAKEFALKEIEKNGSPSIEHFNLSNDMGQDLAARLKADKDLVLIGTMLMDIKLGECIKENKVTEHVERSVEATKEFLEQFNISSKTKDKIINCVAAHHGTIPYICKEAEICANADCYRFIHPKGVFNYFGVLANRYNNVKDCIHQAEKKLDEKWDILSLKICKEELSDYHREFKKMFSKK